MAGDLWDLLDRTRPDPPDPVAHADAAVDVLAASGVDAVLAVGVELDRALDDLYHWDLWGAAYLALGGCGDDGFDYLRAWIVGRGRADWERARTDPEGYFVDLLGDAADPDDRWQALRIHEGEPLLSIAGLAHERLTGAWLPAPDEPRPDEPRGVEWTEDELPRRFPRLASALPDDWVDEVAEAGELDGGPVTLVVGEGAQLDPLLIEVLDASVEGLMAFADGDHDRALVHLEPLVDDPERWAALRATLTPSDVAYAVGIGRLSAGDPDGAADALQLAIRTAAEDGHDPTDEVRRGLAQVELARGELDAADQLLDDGPDAALLDAALRATLDVRRGDRAGAARRVAELGDAPLTALSHPWDRAGVAVVVGLVAIELGDAAAARLAADTVTELIAGAPPELPLHGHALLLRAGAARLAGDLDAAEVTATEALATVTAGDRGNALVERARIARARGDDETARSSYDEAIVVFAAAGERWQAAATRDEADQLGG